MFQSRLTFEKIAIIPGQFFHWTLLTNFNQIFLEPLLDGGSIETIKKVIPRITKSGPKGRVIIRAIVDKNGKVEEAKVVKGLNEYFDEVSLSAAEKFEFSTGKVKGIPVKFYTNIAFEF